MTWGITLASNITYLNKIICRKTQKIILNLSRDFRKKQRRFGHFQQKSRQDKFSPETWFSCQLSTVYSGRTLWSLGWGWCGSLSWSSWFGFHPKRCDKPSCGAWPPPSLPSFWEWPPLSLCGSCLASWRPTVSVQHPNEENMGVKWRGFTFSKENVKPFCEMSVNEWG